MQKMIQHPGKMYPQVSKLQGMDEGSEMPGELRWEVGFFGKTKFRPALRTDGKNKALPDALKDAPEFQDEKGVTNTETDDAVQHTPPDPLWYVLLLCQPARQRRRESLGLGTPHQDSARS